MFAEKLRRMTLPAKAGLLRLACERVTGRAIDGELSRLDVGLLALAWGNPGYAAGFSYLKRVGERVQQAGGPMLECGSGATTLMIAALTKGRDVECVVLEHDRAWYEYLAAMLAQLGFDHVHLVYAPLKDFGGYRWYDVPMDRFTAGIELVVCDGPPGTTPGGRYGLMPVMGPVLARGCVILLDDTHREAEREIIDVWRRDRCLKTSRPGRFGRHTELVCC